MDETSRISDDRDQGNSPSIDRELIVHYLDSVEDAQYLSETDRERFIGTALASQLNPFKREIHLKVTRENGVVGIRIITGYEVYLKKAEQTGLLDGWKVWTEGSGESLRAIVEIRRKDWGSPFLHEVYWTEAVQKDVNGLASTFWERMPRFQLKKVAISQGFRLCFANEIGGMPYESAELPDGDKPGSVPTKQEQRRNETVKNATKLSVVSLVEVIHKHAMEHKDMFSPTHLEWIENQLRQEKTESQLRGLLKHLQGVIESGGDSNEPPRKQAIKRQYPVRSQKIRIPVSQLPAGKKQEIPIF